MGLLDWFSKKRPSEDDEITTVQVEPEEEEFYGLKIKQAIDAHQRWKGRLERALNGTSDETLEIATVSRDDCCALGQWIYSEGKSRFGQMDEFEHLRGAHAQFHLAAGEILLEHESGNTPKALEMLSGNDYRRASNRVQLGIVRLMSRDKLSR